jgi:hypothetical protein
MSATLCRGCASSTHEHLRGLCAIAALGEIRAGRIALGERQRLRKLVKQAQAHCDSPSLRPFGHIFAAAIALDRDDASLAARELGRAVELFDGLSLPMLVVCSQRRLGQLLGGSRGRALVEGSDAFMREQGVVDHDALAELLCPGCAIPS